MIRVLVCNIIWVILKIGIYFSLVKKKKKKKDLSKIHISFHQTITQTQSLAVKYSE